jgi:hypothetical protein
MIGKLLEMLLENDQNPPTTFRNILYWSDPHSQLPALDPVTSNSYNSNREREREGLLTSHSHHLRPLHMRAE